MFSAIRSAEMISDYIQKNAPVALEKIHEEEKGKYTEYVKEHVKEDFEHERISEAEYRYLTRNIDRMSSKMRDDMKPKTDEEKHSMYETIKTNMLAEAGLIVVNDMDMTRDLNLEYTNQAALTM